MCGIIGIIGPNVNLTKKGSVETGLATLALRGPDNSGIVEFSNAIIGHRRLSIIDIAGGIQPMEDSGGNLVITFNGEIYNYRILRTQFEKQGYAFRTRSDTEVILAAYQIYGTACVDHLDGMFAFAIWDKQRQELFLARDRFGEKPLYYAELGSELLFASEIKALLATGLVSSKLDPISLDNYLSLSYVPPWRTIYTAIKPLPPAHYATFKNGVFRKTCYWKLRRKHLNVSFKEGTKVVKEKLEKSVGTRMISDVEVGTFLSGGIDSSIITALAQKLSAPRVIKTFSAGFEGFINELPHAEQLAKQYGTDHHSKQIRADLAKALRDISTYLDEPFADSSSVPTHLLSEFAKNHVPVVLSGDGGDELFFGYGHYRTHWSMSLPRRTAERVRTNIFRYQPNHLMLTFSPTERGKLLRNKSYIERDLSLYLDLDEAETDLQKINLTDFLMTLPGDILPKVDRASMMHSLEVRSPFLQHELVEFVYNLPDSYKTNHTSGKLILANAFHDLIPPEFFTRKKQGFGAPIKQWLKKDELRMLTNSLTQPTARINSLLDATHVRNVVESFSAGNDHFARRVWTLLSLELWMQSHPESYL